MSIKNEPKIKNPLIVAIREQLEHRALWMYLLCDEAKKKGLDSKEYAPDAIRRCGLYQGANLRKKAGGRDVRMRKSGCSVIMRCVVTGELRRVSDASWICPRRLRMGMRCVRSGS